MKRVLGFVIAFGALMMSTVPVGASNAPVVYADTMPGNVIYNCAARSVGPGGLPTAEAGNFTVPSTAKLPRLTLPLAVSTARAAVRVSIVGNAVVVPQHTTWWENEPNEAKTLASKTVRVKTVFTSCGSAQFVNVKFAASAVRLQPGAIYWVVVHPTGNAVVTWFLSRAQSPTYVGAEYVPDGSEPGWFAYKPGVALPNALRVRR